MLNEVEIVALRFRPSHEFGAFVCTQYNHYKMKNTKGFDVLAIQRSDGLISLEHSIDKLLNEFKREIIYDLAQKEQIVIHHVC